MKEVAVVSDRRKRHDRHEGWTEESDDDLHHKKRKGITEGFAIVKAIEPIKPFLTEEASNFLPPKDSLRLEGLTDEEQLYKVCNAICRSVYEYVMHSNPRHTTLCLAVQSFLETFVTRVHSLLERRKSSPSEAVDNGGRADLLLTRSRGVSRKDALLELKSRAEAEERRLQELHQRMRTRFSTDAVVEHNITKEGSPNLSDATDTARTLASDLKANLQRANQVLNGGGEQVGSAFEHLEDLCTRAEEIAYKLSEQLHSDNLKLYPDLKSPHQLIHNWSRV